MTGYCLRDLRRAAGLTQRGLAYRVPVHPMTVAQWEQGRESISRFARLRLLDVFEEVAAERRAMREVLRKWRPA